MTWVLGLLKPFALKIALWGAVGLAVLGVLAGVRKSGRDAERVTNLKKALEAENDRKAVDTMVAVGGDAERKRLLKRYTRD